jgi:hypothetical protein
MGLFTSFLAYRAGKKGSSRDCEEEFAELLAVAEERCDNCGHRRMQHDDRGRCPRYD